MKKFDDMSDFESGEDGEKEYMDIWNICCWFKRDLVGL